MSIEKTVFGTTKQGNSVALYTISNQHGTKIAVTDLGATLVKVIVKDKMELQKMLCLDMIRHRNTKRQVSFLGQLSGDVRTGSGELLLS